MMTAPANAEVPVLVVTGPVGAGKTTVGGAISGVLDSAGVIHAFVDIDHLAHLFPRPQHDRFASEVAMKNLAAVWSNYQAAGARCLIISAVLESPTDRDRYRSAVPDAAIVLVRLRASLSTLTSRLRARETGSSLDWHLRRAEELAQQMESSSLEDLLMDTDDKSVAEVAHEILQRVSDRFP